MEITNRVSEVLRSGRSASKAAIGSSETLEIVDNLYGYLKETLRKERNAKQVELAKWVNVLAYIASRARTNAADPKVFESARRAELAIITLIDSPEDTFEMTNELRQQVILDLRYPDNWFYRWAGPFGPILLGFLLSASSIAACMSGLTLYLGSSHFPLSSDQWVVLVCAAGAAVFGSLISMVVRFESFSKDTVLSPRAIFLNVFLRPWIAVVGSIIVISLFAADIIQLPGVDFGGQDRRSNDLYLSIVVGFLSGFVERLVPTITEEAESGLFRTRLGNRRQEAKTSKEPDQSARSSRKPNPTWAGLHLAAGGVLATAFVLGYAFAAGGAAKLDVMPSATQEYVLVLVLAAIGGALGAWLFMTGELVSSVETYRAAPHSPRSASLGTILILRLLLGAFAGVTVSFVLPASMLADKYSIEIFNRLSLAVLAVFGGYVTARSLQTFIRTVSEMISSADAVEEGVRRAFTPPPLVKYRGYLVCTLQLAADEKSSQSIEAIGRTCIEDGSARLVAGYANYSLKLKLQPEPQPGTVSTQVAIEEGVEGAEAPFTIEINAEEFEPRRTAIKMVGITGKESRTSQLQLTRRTAGPPAEGARLRFSVVQAGRIIQYLTVPLIQ